jgi:hypothetical protein
VTRPTGEVSPARGQLSRALIELEGACLVVYEVTIERANGGKPRIPWAQVEKELQLVNL